MFESSSGRDARVEVAGEPQWREYPIGRAGEVMFALTGTLIAVLVGVGLAFSVVMAAGLIGEEVDLGGANTAVDQFTRASLVPSAGLAVVACLGLALALGVKEMVVSRAVLRAAEQGADRAAVPAPDQIRLILAPGFTGFLVLAGWVLGLGGVFALAAVWAVLIDDLPGGIYVAAAFAVLGALTAVVVVIVKKLRPARRQIRARIADHWTTAHEEAAWSRARHASETTQHTGARDTRITHHTDTDRRRRAGAALTYVAAGLALCAVGAFKLGVVIAYPDAEFGDEYFPQGQLGDRTDLSADAEQLFHALLWVVAGSIVLAVLCFAAGAVVEGSAWAVERGRLLGAVRDPEHPRPDDEILRRHSQRHPVRLAQVVAALAGATFVWSAALWIVSRGAMDDVDSLYRGSAEVFGDWETPAAVIAVVSVALIGLAAIWNGWANASADGLRRELLVRWPVLPEEKPDEDGTVEPWRKGPALSA